MDLLRSVKGYLRTTHEYAVGDRNIVVDGPANVGKTTMLLRLALEVEMAQARMNPDYRRHGHVPMVYIEAAPRAYLRREPSWVTCAQWVLIEALTAEVIRSRSARLQQLGMLLRPHLDENLRRHLSSATT